MKNVVVIAESRERAKNLMMVRLDKVQVVYDDKLETHTTRYHLMTPAEVNERTDYLTVDEIVVDGSMPVRAVWEFIGDIQTLEIFGNEDFESVPLTMINHTR